MHQFSGYIIAASLAAGVRQQDRNGIFCASICVQCGPFLKFDKALITFAYYLGRKGDQMLNTLGEFLDRMVAITVRTEPYLAAASPGSIAELGRARAEQASIITSYQLFVHREVFEPIIASGLPLDVARVIDLKAECVLLAEGFRAFARCWSAEMIEQDWPGYREAAGDFVKRIREHASNVHSQAPAYLHGRTPSPSWRMPGGINTASYVG